MNDLSCLKVGQKVNYYNDDFDAVVHDIPCVVKAIYDDHVIITDIETNTDLWIQEGFNADLVSVKEEQRC